MKKTKLAKRAKTHTNAWWRKEAVKIAKLLAKHRDNYTCITCGRSAEQGYQIHGSHILPESKFLRMSCEPRNIMAQCARCHMDWHENPTQHGWLPKERLDEVIKLNATYQLKITRPDYKEITAQLKEKLKEILQ